MAVEKFIVVEKMVDLWEEASDPRPISCGWIMLENQNVMYI